MTDRTDQAAEARECVALARRATNAKTAALRLSEAQVHATLALVEQKRIANRIALASAVAQASRASGMHGSVLGLIVNEVGLFDNPPTVDGVPPLHADIRAGLGL